MNIIVIVDDKLENLRVLSEMLESDGYNVRGAPNGQTALTMINADLPDLILLDIRMPDMNGYEVCSRLKADEKTKAIPVIFISALSKSSDKIRAFNSGGVDYITKPFQVEEVLARVKTHLSLRRMNTRLRHEITQRQKAEDAIQKANEELERLVQKRTAQLTKANEELKTEIAIRKQADISLRESESQLRHAQKMESVGILAGGIAHDFNNILYVISGYAEVAKYSQLSENHPAFGSINQIIKAVARATALVEQILTFSRQRESAPTAINIHPIIKETIKFLKASSSPTIEIRQNLQADSAIIMGDPGFIQQILINLCTNALHAMKANGGILAVSTENIRLDDLSVTAYQNLKTGPYIKLKVNDTGKGMTGLIKDCIFDPYFTTKKVGEGTGLGLSIVHGIVKSLNGAVTVASEPGKGSMFCVVLPKIKKYAKTEIKKEFEKPPGGQETILVVDDEEQIKNLLHRILETLGYTVFAHNDALVALESFRQNPDQYDLIITDLLMPGITGDKLAIEAMKIRPTMPVILCTGFSEMTDEKRAKEIGVREFVMKPIIRNQIARAIRRVLDG